MQTPLHFKTADRLVFGAGSLAELPDAIKQLGASKPMIVTDSGLVGAGICARVTETVQSAGLACGVFEGVEPDPRIELVDAGTDAARAAGADLVIGLGGGSSLDIAKLVATMMVNEGTIADYIGVDKVPKRGIPTIMIPTTAGTGSEVTPIAVLSDKAEKLKKGVVSDRLYANVALVDPRLMVGLPPHITAYTGIDALTHAIEAYTNRFAQPFVDTFALEAIRLIGANLRQAVAHGDDLTARTNMALGSLYGGMCLGPVNTGAVHALAYPLGGTFGVPHGVANSLLLPYVMEFNLPGKPAEFARIAQALGQNRNMEPAVTAVAESAVTAVIELCADIGIVSRMRELDIPEDAIDGMAEAAMKVTRLLGKNPREVTVEDARAIYRNAY